MTTKSRRRTTLCILIATASPRAVASARSPSGPRPALPARSDAGSPFARGGGGRAPSNPRRGGGGESSGGAAEEASGRRDEPAEAIVDVGVVADEMPDEPSGAGPEMPFDESDGSNDSVDDPDADADADRRMQQIVRRRSDLQQKAAARRAEAKSLHDEGNPSRAAAAFGEAADLLEEALELSPPGTDPSDREADARPEERGAAATVREERATCRLHQALCLLKAGRPEECARVCSGVLGDGAAVAEVSPATDVRENETNDGDEADGNRFDRESEGEEASPSFEAAEGIGRADASSISSQVRARAHLRRSKARLALGDLDGALEDAKKSAFMGDRNAVAFYGRLMREGPGAANSNRSAAADASGGRGDSAEGMSIDPFLEGMLGGLGGGNPLAPSRSGTAGSPDFSSSLLSSLLSDGGGSDGPAGLLGELLSPPPETRSGKFRRRRSKKEKNGIDDLARSVLSNVLKRMEDGETQKTICKYLHSTDANQIMAFASVAGIPLGEESASRLVGMANGITPRGISKCISNIKRVSKAIKTARKILKVIDKYKTVLVLMMLCVWIKSAIVEPYPVDKRRAKRLVKEAIIVGVVSG